MLILFGIPNCDQVKKTQKWLNDHNISYEFHDVKKLGVTGKRLIDWCKTVPWEDLLNKRSRTWKQLSETQRSNLTQAKAISLLQQNPTFIKRPVIQFKNKLEVGFDSKQYNKHFL